MFDSPSQSLNCRGRLLDLARPQVVGILNLTPDSFSDGGQYNTTAAALRRTETMLREGAAVIDIGAASSRPGAEPVPVEEELRRLTAPVTAIREAFPEAILSIDTPHAAVASEMLAAGAAIINDISGGRDPAMLSCVAAAGAPYILMHMQGTPQTMQQVPAYQDVVQEVYAYFVERLQAAASAGLHDVVLDPGFGFGKTYGHNAQLLQGLGAFMALQRPLMLGISRKRSLRELTGRSAPAELLPATAALHLHALRAGARLLRVHDVAAAVDVVESFVFLEEERAAT